MSTILPSGIWVRQALRGSKVRITYVPRRRTEKPSVAVYDQVSEPEKDLGWIDVFNEIDPNLKIDEGVIFLQMSASGKTAYLTWIPNDLSKQPVETSHAVPPPVPGGAAGLATYFACVAGLGAAVTPAVALAVCSPALLLPG